MVAHVVVSYKGKEKKRVVWWDGVLSKSNRERERRVHKDKEKVAMGHVKEKKRNVQVLKTTEFCKSQPRIDRWLVGSKESISAQYPSVCQSLEEVADGQDRARDVSQSNVTKKCDNNKTPDTFEVPSKSNVLNCCRSDSFNIGEEESMEREQRNITSEEESEPQNEEDVAGVSGASHRATKESDTSGGSSNRDGKKLKEKKKRNVPRKNMQKKRIATSTPRKKISKKNCKMPSIRKNKKYRSATEDELRLARIRLD